MRQLALNEISSSDVSFRMLSFINKWGEDDEVVNAIFKTRNFETDALIWWLAFCKNGSVSDIVIDAGAYTGIYSLAAVSQNPNLRAIAFEASAITYGRLVLNILANNLETRIIPNHIALTDAEGTIQLSHASGIYTMSSGETVSPCHDRDHFEQVFGLSLDACFLTSKRRLPGALGSTALSVGSFSGIRAIKIDVEGAEKEVISGAVDLLRTYQPGLIIEIFSAQRRAEIEAIIEPLSYTLIAECSGSNLVYCPNSKVEELRDHYSLTSEANSAAFDAVRRLIITL